MTFHFVVIIKLNLPIHTNVMAHDHKAGYVKSGQIATWSYLLFVIIKCVLCLPLQKNR